MGNCPICGKPNPEATHYGDGCLKYALAHIVAVEARLVLLQRMYDELYERHDTLLCEFDETYDKEGKLR